MIFRFRGKDFKGPSWIDVVRSLERDDKEYRPCGGPIRHYLSWSLNQLRGTVSPRDIHLSDRLEDETLALGYLLLLDEYGIGELWVQLIHRRSDHEHSSTSGRFF